MDHSVVGSCDPDRPSGAVPLDSLPMPALVVDPTNLRILDGNEKAGQLLGPTVGRNLPVLVPGVDRARLLERVDGRPTELRLEDQLGRHRVVEAHVSAVSSPDPAIPGALLLTLVDTTERTRTEASLRRAFLTQKTLSDLLRATRDHRPLEDQLGEALELIVSLPWAPFGPAGCLLIGDEQSLEVVARVGVVLGLGPAREGGFSLCACAEHLLDPSGNRAESSLLGRYDPDMTISVSLHAASGVVGHLVLQGPPPDELDPFETELLSAVTRHLGQVLSFARAREAALEQSQNHRLMVERAVHAVVTHDGQGRITAFNPAAERMFGYSANEILGRPIGQLIPAMAEGATPPPGLPTDRALPNLPNLLGSPRELEALRRDEGRFPILLELVETPHRGEPAYTAFVRDETARKQAEEQLVRAREAAIEASNTKSRFLANMSHEIRTPMNGVIGMTEILLGTELDAAQRDAVETIRSSGEALLSVINDVLDFSRIEAGKLEISPSPFELTRVVRDVTRLLEPKGETKGVTLETHLDPAIPPWVIGDDGRVRQILINLIGNAIKFTEEGEVSLQITRVGSGEMVRFAVRDTGIGMTEDALSKLFQPFVQADGEITRRFGGSGLGLTISRQLAELMGGRITATSAPGVGSTFVLQIPLPASGQQEEMTTEDLLALDFTGVQILLVEDNQVNQKVATRLLEKLGVAVTIAANGKEGIERVASQPFDLILMDCQMPVMDGFEATRRLRAMGVQTPIVALTANAMKGDAENCKAAGMDEFLSKPVRRKDLEQMLARISSTHDFAVRRSLTD